MYGLFSLGALGAERFKWPGPPERLGGLRLILVRPWLRQMITSTPACKVSAVYLLPLCLCVRMQVLLCRLAIQAPTPNAPSSLQVALTDHSGMGTVTFVACISLSLVANTVRFQRRRNASTASHKVIECKSSSLSW